MFFKPTHKTYKQVSPELPGFNDYDLIFNHVQGVKSKFYKHLTNAIQLYITFKKLYRNPNLPIGNNDIKLWIIGCICEIYGVIYFASRHEIEKIKEIAFNEKEKLSIIEELLKKENGYVSIMNYAIHSFFCEEIECINCTPPFDLPQYSYFFKNKKLVYVDKQRKITDPSAILNSTTPFYDLHDFSHYICQLLNDTLYGCKLFETFDVLPDAMKQLILDQDYENILSNPFSDNVLFRKLSLVGLDEMYQITENEEDIEEYLSEQFVKYFSGHSNAIIPNKARPGMKLKVWELAVLSEHKIYEYAASEMEEHLFIRGGKDHNQDPLHGLSIFEKIDKIHDSGLFYYEKRNYLRHRSLRRAYLKYAMILSHQKPNLDLAKSIVKTLKFERHMGDPNLFTELLTDKAMHSWN